MYQNLKRTRSQMPEGLFFFMKSFVLWRYRCLSFLVVLQRERQKKNRAKTMGLTTKTTSPHVHYILTSLHDLDVKFLDGPFSGGRKHTRLISFLVPAFQPFVYFKSII